MSDKFCVNCTHFVLNDSWATLEKKKKYGLCSYKNKINNVTGCPDVENLSVCRIERTMPLFISILVNNCGKSGRFYEEKS